MQHDEHEADTLTVNTPAEPARTTAGEAHARLPSPRLPAHRASTLMSAQTGTRDSSAREKAGPPPQQVASWAAHPQDVCSPPRPTHQGPGFTGVSQLEPGPDRRALPSESPPGPRGGHCCQMAGTSIPHYVPIPLALKA